MKLQTTEKDPMDAKEEVGGELRGWPKKSGGGERGLSVKGRRGEGEAVVGRFVTAHRQSTAHQSTRPAATLNMTV